MGQRLNCASTGRTDRSQELPLSERMDLYLGVAVTLMFVSGCFLIVLSLREQFEKRKRQRIWTSVKPRPSGESESL
jgi:hypothetical protein